MPLSIEFYGPAYIRERPRGTPSTSSTLFTQFAKFTRFTTFTWSTLFTRFTKSVYKVCFIRFTAFTRFTKSGSLSSPSLVHSLQCSQGLLSLVYMVHQVYKRCTLSPGLKVYVSGLQRRFSSYGRVVNPRKKKLWVFT